MTAAKVNRLVRLLSEPVATSPVQGRTVIEGLPWDISRLCPNQLYTPHSIFLNDWLTLLWQMTMILPMGEQMVSTHSVRGQE